MGETDLPPSQIEFLHQLFANVVFGGWIIPYIFASIFCIYDLQDLPTLFFEEAVGIRDIWDLLSITEMTYEITKTNMLKEYSQVVCAQRTRGLVFIFLSPLSLFYCFDWGLQWLRGRNCGVFLFPLGPLFHCLRHRIGAGYYEKCFEEKMGVMENCWRNNFERLVLDIVVIKNDAGLHETTIILLSRPLCLVEIAEFVPTVSEGNSISELKRVYKVLPRHAMKHCIQAIWSASKRAFFLTLRKRPRRCNG